MNKEELKEITKEEAKNLPILTTYYIYNPLTDVIKEEIATPIDIAHNKHCYEKLRFYIEVKINEK